MPASQLAVVASTNTWNAYNNFGGRSNYINAATLPQRPTVVAHLDLPRYVHGTPIEHSYPDSAYAPLSFERPEPLNQITRFERPTDPIRGRQPCHLAAASRVRQWVFERGGRLVYLGGNGLDCEVSFVNEATLVFRTQDEAPPYENRMHRSFEPTAALLGVMFTSTGAMTAAPYRVVDESHWAFQGTGLRAGDVFGAASLHERVPGGASIVVDDGVSHITRNVLDRFLA